MCTLTVFQAAADHGPGQRGPGQVLGDEPGLADPRVAHHQGRVRGPGANGRGLGQEVAQLRLAADKGGGRVVDLHTAKYVHSNLLRHQAFGPEPGHGKGPAGQRRTRREVAGVS